ncbi:MAG: hypothetical protein PF692_04015 [Kiritimatiellae bacterium]|nr:hypothetical protein [Kiritimatiellia bacterium]
MNFLSLAIIIVCLLAGCNSNNKTDEEKKVCSDFGSYNFFDQLVTNSGCITFYGNFDRKSCVGFYISDTNSFANICKESLNMTGSFELQTNINVHLPLYKISSKTGNLEQTWQSVQLEGVYMVLEEDKKDSMVSVFYELKPIIPSSTDHKTIIFVNYNNREVKP